MQLETKYLGRKVDPAQNTQGKPWEHFLWSISLEHNGQAMRTTFKCGVAHFEKRKANSYIRPKIELGEWRDEYGADMYYIKTPKAPSLFDILYSLCLDSQSSDNAASFEDWCLELGYSPDSISADRIYRACLDNARNLRRILGRELYDTLCAMQENELADWCKAHIVQ